MAHADDEQKKAVMDCVGCSQNFLETSNKPYLMLCGHSTCAQCIPKSISQAENGEGVAKCPSCRVTTPLENPELPALPENSEFLKLFAEVYGRENQSMCTCSASPVQVFCPTCDVGLCRGCSDTLHAVPALRSHIPRIQQVTPSEQSTSPLCSCGEQPVSLFCQSCDVPFCAACSRLAHAVPALRHHLPTITPISKDTPCAPSPLCAEHEEPLKLFCLTDNAPVCVLCRDYGSHAGHKLDLLSNVAAQQLARVGELLCGVDTSYASLCGAAAALAEQDEALQRQMAAAARDVTAHMEAVVLAVQQRKEALLLRVRREHARIQRKLRLRRAVVASALSACHTTRHLCQASGISSDGGSGVDAGSGSGSGNGGGGGGGGGSGSKNRGTAAAAADVSGLLTGLRCLKQAQSTLSCCTDALAAADPMGNGGGGAVRLFYHLPPTLAEAVAQHGSVGRLPAPQVVSCRVEGTRGLLSWEAVAGADGNETMHYHVKYRLVAVAGDRAVVAGGEAEAAEGKEAAEGVFDPPAAAGDDSDGDSRGDGDGNGDGDGDGDSWCEVEMTDACQYQSPLLTCSSSYEFRVAARDLRGLGRWSVPRTIQTPKSALLLLKLWGGGGAAGQHSHGNSGGAGGFIQAHYILRPAEVLTVVVGQGGTLCTSGQTKTPGGAGLPNGGHGRGDYNSGGGGGASYITSSLHSDEVIVGAGGGGGSSGGKNHSPGGGGGGGTCAGVVGQGGCAGANAGGAPTATPGTHGGGGGGAGSSSNDAGGASAGGGGAGGRDGAPGVNANGAGGTCGTQGNAGGGGGGGAASWKHCFDAEVENATSHAAPKASDPHYSNSCGRGGTGSGAGSHGRIVILNATTGSTLGTYGGGGPARVTFTLPEP